MEYGGIDECDEMWGNAAMWGYGGIKSKGKSQKLKVWDGGFDAVGLTLVPVGSRGNPEKT